MEKVTFSQGQTVAWKMNDGTPDPTLSGQIIGALNPSDGWGEAQYIVQINSVLVFKASESDIVAIS